MLSRQLSVYALIGLLSSSPAWAEKLPGYEKYKDGHQGYLGDGVLGKGEDEAAELARAVQNPVADLISVPLQNNTNFNFGPRERTQNVLNIQPVVPLDLSEEWLMITRTILPVVSQPSFFSGDDGRENGLGDATVSAFLSPKDRSRWLGDWLWGLGPTLLVPTSTDDRLGPGEWGAGPSAVFLTMPGRWVIGSLFTQIWSFTDDGGADEVSLFTWQPFINYNLDGGWYLSSSPLVTANWEGDDTWTVPVGGGLGRIVRLGKQPVNLSLQGFYNAVEPDNIGPEYSIRFTWQFLFPRGQ
ncbi:MAG: neuromedin U [Gammaproteobacteria bacterium]